MSRHTNGRFVCGFTVWVLFIVSIHRSEIVDLHISNDEMADDHANGHEVVYVDRDQAKKRYFGSVMNKRKWESVDEPISVVTSRKRMKTEYDVPSWLIHLNDETRQTLQQFWGEQYYLACCDVEFAEQMIYDAHQFIEQFSELGITLDEIQKLCQYSLTMQFSAHEQLLGYWFGGHDARREQKHVQEFWTIFHEQDFDTVHFERRNELQKCFQIILLELHPLALQANSAEEFFHMRTNNLTLVMLFHRFCQLYAKEWFQILSYQIRGMLSKAVDHFWGSSQDHFWWSSQSFATDFPVILTKCARGTTDTRGTVTAILVSHCSQFIVPTNPTCSAFYRQRIVPSIDGNIRLRFHPKNGWNAVHLNYESEGISAGRKSQIDDHVVHLNYESEDIPMTKMSFHHDFTFFSYLFQRRRWLLTRILFFVRNCSIPTVLIREILAYEHDSIPKLFQRGIPSATLYHGQYYAQNLPYHAINEFVQEVTNMVFNEFQDMPSMYKMIAHSYI